MYSFINTHLVLDHSLETRNGVDASIDSNLLGLDLVTHCLDSTDLYLFYNSMKYILEKSFFIFWLGDLK
jgi:hypothetical protein